MTATEANRRSKQELARMIEEFERARGCQFVYGGPAMWSKDELVSYLVRETDLLTQ